MFKKRINRKEFLTKTIAGIAAFRFIPDNIAGNHHTNPILNSIGNTGIMASPLCFGATRTNEESLIKYAMNKGMNFLDTGRSYANGNNETLVGKALTGIRDRVIIQSKLRLEERELSLKGKGKKGAAEIKDTLTAKLEASLKALNTDYIDILLYHDAVEENLLFHNEVLKFFSEMKATGVIHAHGFSSHNDKMNLPERNNSDTFYDLIMVPFNPFGSFVHSLSGRYSDWNQEKLITILTEAGNKGIGVIAMKTCSGGKYSPSPDIEPSFEAAVLWVLEHDFISSAAIAMSNFEQVDEHTSRLKSK